MSFGLTKSDSYLELYIMVIYGDPLILVLSLDDLFLSRLERLIVRCKRVLALDFKMKHLGMMHYFLGLRLWQRSYDIFIK